MRPEIQPAPTPEEAAAIAAAVAVVEFIEATHVPERSADGPARGRWATAARLGRPLPEQVRPEGSLWALAGRGRMP